MSPLRNAQKFEELERFPYPHVEDCGASDLVGAVAEAHEEQTSVNDEFTPQVECSEKVPPRQFL